MKNRSGFTLIELLVVISVISIIIGVVIPRFKGMQDEANKAKAKAELKTLQTAVESFFINQTPQEYPASTGTICLTYLNSASPVIVSTPLYDPFASAGDEYIYEIAPSGSYYVIFSVGPNQSRDIGGVGDDGYLTGNQDDDIYVTNGLGWT